MLLKNFLGNVTRLPHKLIPPQKSLTQEFAGRIQHLSWSPDGKYLIVVASDGKATIFNTEKNSQKTLIHEKKYHGTMIFSTWTSENSPLTLSNHSIKRWNLKTNKEEILFEHLVDKEESSKSIDYINWSQDQEYLILHNRHSGLQIKNTLTETEENPKDLFHQKKDGPFYFDRKKCWIMYSIKETGLITVYDIKNKKEIICFNPLAEHIDCLVMDSTHQHIYVVCNIRYEDEKKNYFQVWDLAGELLKSYTLPSGHISSIDIHPKFPLVAIGLASIGKVQVINVNEKNIKKNFKAHKDWLSILAFHPDKPLLVTGGWDQKMIFWNLSLREFKI